MAPSTAAHAIHGQTLQRLQCLLIATWLVACLKTKRAQPTSSALAAGWAAVNCVAGLSGRKWGGMVRCGVA